MKVAVLIACLVAATLAVRQKPQQSFLCDVCHFMGKEMNMRVLDDDTKEQFLETAQEMCVVLPSSLVNQCIAMVNQHGTEIVDEIFKTLNLEPYCDEIEIFGEALCPHDSTLNTMTSTMKSEDGCKACKDSLDMLKMLLSSEDMKDLLHVAINETCMAIGGSVDVCEAMVTTVVDEILGNLLPMFNVEALCRFSGSCAAPSWLAAHSSDVECLLCKDGFGMIEALITSPELTDILDVATNMTCKALGIDDRCKDIGSFLTEQLVDYLKEVANPDMVCGQLGVCPAVVKEKALFQAAVQANEGCKACMDAFDIIQSIMKAKETEDLVHIAVNEMCLAIAGNQAETCEKIVEGIIDPIIKQLVFLFDPATLCKKAGACANLLMVDAEGAICDICIDGIEEVKNIAEDKEVADMLSKITDVVCDAISIPFCKAALNTIVKEALQGMKNIDANATCATLDACPKYYLENVAGGPFCSMCEMASNAVINAIVKNKEFHALVSKGIALVCKVWPGDDCPQLLDTAFQAMIQALEAFGGQEICTLIGLC